MNKLTAKEIIQFLDGGFDVTVKEETGSTNDDAKVIAADAADLTVIVAERQLNGRGRLDRQFYSPKDSGVYFSVVLKPKSKRISDYITVMAAVAVCDGIEKTLGIKAGIKWVNDIMLNGKKVAGILAEGVTDNQGMTAVVLGIGINITAPDGGFPDAIRDIAGALTDNGDYRARLTAEVLNSFARIYKGGDVQSAVRAYRKKSVLIGKTVTVAQADGDFLAAVLDIDDECHLLVKKQSGEVAALTYGDVSVKY